ncbi:ABC transporter ATP-binding protein [Thalassobacillus sp. CUG 92003]|uniref:ABC transporter ATP-binding protein n=1 Tax=Thalassobacillus sp. CUG 92003 TaxID=2736641 RepID=UPI0015E6B50B|nr:ABC transporter ATP-binding protein [Thalassobacillus sp. CUG 92003]
MIRVENLSYTYPRGLSPALSDLSFKISPGEIFGLIGPSGAGKSTLQKLLTGLLPTFEGSMTIWNYDMHRLPRSFYNMIGVVFETADFYEKLTAVENLEFFGSLYKQTTGDPMYWLERFGLIEAAHQRVGSFSKGMKMRLSLCRALQHEPQLLLLDEPTSGLDPSWSVVVKDILKEQQEKGVTIVLSTHHMSVAQDICDQLAFIVDGAIPVIAPPKQLQLLYGQKRISLTINSGEEREEVVVAFDDYDRHSIITEALQAGTLETIHSQEASLDDVFIHVTGRKLDG